MEDPTNELTFESLTWAEGQAALATVNDEQHRSWVYRFEGVVAIDARLDPDIREDWPGEIQDLMRTKDFKHGRRKVCEYWIAVGNMHFTITAESVHLLIPRMRS